MNKLSVIVSEVIDAPVSKAWQALTDPEMISQYLFGTNVVSDWQQGSPITYHGEWEGKHYEDKGQIVKIVPPRLLHTTYFSGMSGKEDVPENYANVIYEVQPHGTGKSEVTITQDNIEDEAGVEHMKKNWGLVLAGMKKLLEAAAH